MHNSPAAHGIPAALDIACVSRAVVEAELRFLLIAGAGETTWPRSWPLVVRLAAAVVLVGGGGGGGEDKASASSSSLFCATFDTVLAEHLYLRANSAWDIFCAKSSSISSF